MGEPWRTVGGVGKEDPAAGEGQAVFSGCIFQRLLGDQRKAGKGLSRGRQLSEPWQRGAAGTDLVKSQYWLGV